MEPVGKKPGVQSPANTHINKNQNSGEGIAPPPPPSSPSPKLEGLSKKASSDTQLAEREMGIVSAVTGYIRRGVGGLWQFLFPGASEVKRDLSRGGDAAPTLDRKGQSQYEMELQIYEAGETYIAGPPVPPLQKALESAEKAHQYVKESESRELDLKGLLEQVKTIPSKTKKEMFFRSIFSAKTLGEWKEFAILQMLDLEELNENCREKFMELTCRLSPEDFPENREVFRKEWRSEVFNQVKRQLVEAPEQRILQLRELVFLVKQLSAIQLDLNTSSLTDDLDRLVARQPVDEMLELETLPEVIKTRFLQG